MLTFKLTGTGQLLQFGADQRFLMPKCTENNYPIVIIFGWPSHVLITFVQDPPWKNKPQMQKNIIFYNKVSIFPWP